MFSDRSLLAAVLTALLFTANPLSAQQPAAQVPADPHAFDTIIQKLGDPSFNVREQAQALLDQIPLAQRDALAQVAEKTADEEIKARLLQQVGAMDERIGTDPPPISLDLQDASVTEVARALGKAVGTTFDIRLPSGALVPPGAELPNPTRFSLQAVNQPFWEVVRQLSSQHPLWLVPTPGASSDRLNLTERTFERIQVFRGMAFLADSATVAPGNKVTLTLNLALDPRIVVIDLHPMQVADARDDQGHLLHLDPEPVEAAARVAALRRVTAQGLAHFQSKSVTFTATEAPGKTLTVKGTVNFLVEIAHTTVEIANATQRLNQAIALGDSTVTLRDFLHSAPAAGARAGGAALRKSVGIALQIMPKDSPTPAPDMPNIEITATGGISLRGGITSRGGATTVIDTEGSAGGITLGSAAGSERTRILVTDATGKTVANYAVARGIPVTSVHIVSDDFKEPLKFTLTYPTRTREVVVPFEFKDLPIKP